MAKTISTASAKFIQQMRKRGRRVAQVRGTPERLVGMAPRNSQWMHRSRLDSASAAASPNFFGKPTSSSKLPLENKNS